ncbi:MAG: 3-methyl-2-oxobutanoate hydroxymethyltransferase [Chloroflexota bacterium]|nr:MAG: 3-methyl-2-oxobutanoate hydroxymethyltransferase [Chloroflexota bacterium]
MSDNAPEGKKNSTVTKKISILDILSKKGRGAPVTMMTAYDYPSALLVDEAGMDIILVGDSLGMVVLGLDNTVPVTMDEMLHHCRAVARGARRSYLVGDMPFMSYQADSSEAIRNAGRFMKEGLMDSVKLEGGREVVDTVAAIINAGIPVMGHIGLTPQSASKLGGYRVQGKSAADAIRLLHDAQALQDAGCYSIVLEAVPAPVAQAISERLNIPTIGIGAGVGCDGQVLVYHDLVGMFDRFTPKFVRRYAEVGETISSALRSFVKDVVDRRFPADEHTYSIDEGELQRLYELLEQQGH